MSLWQLQSSSNLTNFADNVLLKKTQNFCLFKGNWHFFCSSHIGKENLQGSCDHPMGGGMLGKTSKIVILCYYVSLFYLMNYFKIFRILKIVVKPLHPLVGEECGVTHQL